MAVHLRTRLLYSSRPSMILQRGWPKKTFKLSLPPLPLPRTNFTNHTENISPGRFYKILSDEFCLLLSQGKKEQRSFSNSRKRSTNLFAFLDLSIIWFIHFKWHFFFLLFIHPEASSIFDKMIDQMFSLKI